MSDRAAPSLKRHVNKVEKWEGRDRLPALIEDAEAVERMVDSPGWQAVRQVIALEIATIDGALDEGPAKESAAEYARAHGRRGGLRAFEEAAKGIIEQARTRREDAEAAEAAGESVAERAGV